MPITIFEESGIVINVAQKTDTLDNIVDYISQHIESWVNYNVIWDVTLLEWESINSQSIRSFVQNTILLSNKRLGHKTAILANSDVGFGMMRMLQMLAEEKNKIEFRVFRTKAQALSWINIPKVRVKPLPPHPLP